MAEVLRELIARVVLRVDPSSLKRLDTLLDASKAKLAALKAAGEEGVNVNVDSSATQSELAGIRVQLRTLGDNVTPELSAKLRAQLESGRAKAEELRGEIDKLKFLNPDSEKLGVLQRQLNGIESEARETAAALDKLDDQFKKVGNEAGKFPGLLGKVSSGLGALGIGLGIAGLTTFVHQTLEAAGAVEDFADRLGVSTDEAQVWSAFAKQAGADNEALTASFKGLANAMQGAANGGKEQKAAFDALGISTDKWKNGLPPLTDTLALVGGKLAELDSEGQRLALTQKLLSEGGLKLAPAFKGGTKAAQEHLDKLKELAVVYSEDFVKSAGEAGDELDMFYGQFRGLGSELILTFLPALRGAVRELTPLIRGFRDGFKNSNIFTAGLVAAGSTGLASFGGISGALSRLWPMLGRIAAAAAPFIRGFLRFAAIALIVDDFFTMLNGGRSVLGDLLKKFELGRTILETFQTTWKGLKGTVLLAWGALSGNEEALNQGKQLLNDFTQWIDNILGNVGFMFDDVFMRLIPQLVRDGWNSLDESTRAALGGIWEFVTQWAADLAGVIGGVWDAAIAGLKRLTDYAGELIAKIPGLGDLFSSEPGATWQPISAAGQNMKAALDAGSPNNPYLPVGNTASVVINNNQQVNTSIGAGAPRETVAAVQQVERTVARTVTKDNARVLRHTVGATR